MRSQAGAWERVCVMLHFRSQVVSQLKHFLELIRFSHTVFALPFALFAGVLAWSRPDSPFQWTQLLGILLCMVFARSAAMAFNRLIDRRIDADNPRTAGRHIPAGLLSVSSVWTFTIVCSLAFVGSTLLFLPNRWPIFLSVPVLLFLLSYSLAKRFTSFCHYWLSAALMLSPIATWIAIRGELHVVPALLAAVVFFWVGGFDIIYACQDVDVDRKLGLSSIPARWGVARALRVALSSHVAMLASLIGLWYVAALGPVFLVGIVVVAALLAWEHSLVRPDDLTRVNIAFFNVNAILSLGILVVGVIDVWFVS